MYKIGKIYKIELKMVIFYTANVLEEDASSIIIETIKGEELVLNKDEVKRALVDRTERGEDEGI